MKKQLYAEAWRLRREGMKFIDIGAMMNISPSKAHVWASKGKSRECRVQMFGESPFYDLSVRTQNGLLCAAHSINGEWRAPTANEIRDWVESGKLPKGFSLGEKSLQEIKVWLAACAEKGDA